MSKLSVNELTDETGSGAPSFPNGVSVTGAALTDPEITGGIYLGGTGSANYLDDYETGTWTAEFIDNGGVGSFHALTGYYTKIGNFVWAFAFEISTTPNVSPSGNLVISGLPFALANNDRYRGVFFSRASSNESYQWEVNSPDNNQIVIGSSENNANTADLLFTNGGTVERAGVEVTYFTDD